MDTLAADPFPIDRQMRASRAWRDIALVAAATVLTFVVAGRLELSEGIGGWLTHFEAYQLDELPAAIIVMIAGLGWFSWRRSREVGEQMALRLAAQQALNEQERQFRVLFAEDLSGNLLADAEGRVTLANPELARILGLSAPEQALALRIGDFYADTAQWEAHREALGRGEAIESSGLRLRRLDGTEVLVIARLRRRREPGGRIELHGFFADVTALEAVRAELARALAENRRLAQRGIENLEAERRHIARELHDEMGQWLNALKIDAVSIRDRADMPAEVRNASQAIVDLTDHVYDVARTLMRRLRPVALDELGLASALQYSVDQWQRRHPGVRCRCEVAELPGTFGEVVNITLYRVVQECLTNVTKHAGARSVDVRLDWMPEEGLLGVTVKDDGAGFDAKTTHAGLGLVGLRERVESLGGRFRVDGAPGAGTTVHALVPARITEEAA